MVFVQRVSAPDDAALAALVAEAGAEGHGFVARLAAGFADGSNRFDGPGEALFEARRAGVLVGVGGLNRDPYLDDPAIGRVRHLYVARAARGAGAGRAIVAAIVAAAKPAFEVLTLRTSNPDAARFYVAIGFTEDATYPHATHWRAL